MPHLQLLPMSPAAQLGENAGRKLRPAAFLLSCEHQLSSMLETLLLHWSLQVFQRSKPSNKAKQTKDSSPVFCPLLIHLLVPGESTKWECPVFTCLHCSDLTFLPAGKGMVK